MLEVASICLVNDDIVLLTCVCGKFVAYVGQLFHVLKVYHMVCLDLVPVRIEFISTKQKHELPSE